MVKEKKIPLVDYKLCMACRVCITACPFSCLEADKTDIDSYRKAYPALVRPETCTGCGICAKSCPIDVIIMVS
ncbi:MAG: 4Fe-4S binding protein [Spirochaetales bacterium]|nr:4Fe-4S binding protein [Spirochaetales bacterium]